MLPTVNSNRAYTNRAGHKLLFASRIKGTVATEGPGVLLLCASRYETILSQTTQHRCIRFALDALRAARTAPATASTKESTVPPPPSPSLLLDPDLTTWKPACHPKPCGWGCPHLSIKVMNRIVCRTHLVRLLMLHIPALGSRRKPGVRLSVQIYIQGDNTFCYRRASLSQPPQ